jgi:hypothetical protein
MCEKLGPSVINCITEEKRSPSSTSIKVLESGPDIIPIHSGPIKPLKSASVRQSFLLNSNIQPSTSLTIHKDQAPAVSENAMLKKNPPPGARQSILGGAVFPGFKPKPDLIVAHKNANDFQTESTPVMFLSASNLASASLTLMREEIPVTSETAIGKKKPPPGARQSILVGAVFPGFKPKPGLIDAQKNVNDFQTESTPVMFLSASNLASPTLMREELPVTFETAIVKKKPPPGGRQSILVGAVFTGFKTKVEDDHRNNITNELKDTSLGSSKLTPSMEILAQSAPPPPPSSASKPKQIERQPNLDVDSAPVTSGTEIKSKDESITKAIEKESLKTPGQPETKSFKYAVHINDNPRSGTAPVTSGEIKSKDDIIIKSMEKESLKTPGQPETKSFKYPVKCNDIPKSGPPPVTSSTEIKSKDEIITKSIEKESLKTPGQPETKSFKYPVKCNDIFKSGPPPVTSSNEIKSKDEIITKSIEKESQKTPGQPETKSFKYPVKGNDIPKSGPSPVPSITEIKSKDEIITKSIEKESLKTPEQPETKSFKYLVRGNDIPKSGPSPVPSSTEIKSKDEIIIKSNEKVSPGQPETNPFKYPVHKNDLPPRPTEKLDSKSISTPTSTTIPPRPIEPNKEESKFEKEPTTTLPKRRVEYNNPLKVSLEKKELPKRPEPNFALKPKILPVGIDAQIAPRGLEQMKNSMPDKEAPIPPWKKELDARKAKLA